MKNFLFATASVIAVVLLAPDLSYAQARGGPAATPSVIVQDVYKEKIFDTIEALGNLRANETVKLNAQVTEKITAIKFEDGQRVKAGDILVEMTSTEESALLAEEQFRVDEALRQVERLKPLIAQGATSKANLDTRQREYETSKARLDVIRSQMADRIIVAPFDGVVGLRNISVGTLVQPGMEITTLDDDSVMKLDFDVSSVFLATIKEGLPIKALTKAFPDRQFEGTIASIDNQINPVTRAIKVRALIPNPDRLLKPGLLMTVRLFTHERTSVIVPEESLLMIGEKSFVYTAEDKEGKTIAVRREVSTGTRQPGRVEIVTGLEEGQKIISHGIMSISDGAAIVIRGTQKPGEDVKKILEQGQNTPASAPVSQK